MAANVQKLIAECKAKGVDPDKVETFCTHGASGVTNELSSGSLDQITGRETAGPVVDMEKGEYYIDFYCGN